MVQAQTPRNATSKALPSGIDTMQLMQATTDPDPSTPGRTPFHSKLPDSTSPTIQVVDAMPHTHTQSPLRLRIGHTNKHMLIITQLVTMRVMQSPCAGKRFVGSSSSSTNLCQLCKQVQPAIHMYTQPYLLQAVPCFGRVTHCNVTTTQASTCVTRHMSWDRP